MPLVSGHLHNCSSLYYDTFFHSAKTDPTFLLDWTFAELMQPIGKRRHSRDWTNLGRWPGRHPEGSRIVGRRLNLAQAALLLQVSYSRKLEWSNLEKGRAWETSIRGLLTACKVSHMHCVYSYTEQPFIPQSYTLTTLYLFKASLYQTKIFVGCGYFSFRWLIGQSAWYCSIHMCRPESLDTRKYQR